jgi:DNA polymerase I-like protein with 3'-5' exonuclease and polymerase domains
MSYVPELSDLNLKNVDTVAIDLETYDPDLKTLGSGAIRNNGKVCGIAIAYKDEKLYFPIRHSDSTSQVGKAPSNIAPNHVWKILNKKIFQNKNITKVFHNAMYDVCWIRQESKLMVQGPIVDTMIAASIIDENKMRYSLDALAKEYLKGETKYKYDLEKAAEDEVGISNAISNMHLLPYSVVKSYAEQDVNLTLKLWNIFKKKIKSPIKTINGKIKTLENIFNLEMELFPCLVDMRFKGVRVDTKKAETLGLDLKKRRESIIKGIKRRTGISIEIWAADSVEKLLHKLNITDYTSTPKSGRVSLSKSYLESHSNVYLRLVARARAYDKLVNVFVNGLLKFVHNGRIHADINQIRGERGGTITGRFSMAKPNLQQIPAKGKYGNIIRSFFLPEEGQQWGSFDYSQQEPRLVVHYALKNNFYGVKNLAEEYRKNPDTDFHKIVAKMAKITRKQAKTINLGLFYGMGKGKLAASLELDKEEAKELFDAYHRQVPFVRELSNGLMKFAEKNKSVFTLEDRFCRFNKWEPRDKEWDEDRKVFIYTEYVETEEDGEVKKEIQRNPVPILEKKQAQDHYLASRSRSLADNDPHCKMFEEFYKPAFTYKALNKLIQGSAADMTKKAMILLYKEGILPHIQIHDELCISIPNKETALKIIDIMKNAIRLKIPNKVDYASGNNWGTIK